MAEMTKVYKQAVPAMRCIGKIMGIAVLWVGVLHEAMPILPTIVLSGSVYLSLSQNIAVKYHEIMMITIATYPFCKIILAILGAIKVRKRNSPLLTTLHNISAVRMRRLGPFLAAFHAWSFGNRNSDNIRIMNMATGAAMLVSRKRKDKRGIQTGANRCKNNGTRRCRLHPNQSVFYGMLSDKRKNSREQRGSPS